MVKKTILILLSLITIVYSSPVPEANPVADADANPLPEAEPLAYNPNLVQRNKSYEVVPVICDEKEEFVCRDRRRCIPIGQVCDGEPDCIDESDEDKCETRCTGNMFKCMNGKCIDRAWICDSMDDCGDGSDERSCLSAGAAPCPPGEFRCRGVGGVCISSNWLCDGSPDCPGGEDEERCENFTMTRVYGPDPWYPTRYTFTPREHRYWRQRYLNRMSPRGYETYASYTGVTPSGIYPYTQPIHRTYHAHHDHDGQFRTGDPNDPYHHTHMYDYDERDPNFSTRRQIYPNDPYPGTQSYPNDPYPGTPIGGDLHPSDPLYQNRLAAMTPPSPYPDPYNPGQYRTGEYDRLSPYEDSFYRRRYHSGYTDALGRYHTGRFDPRNWARGYTNSFYGPSDVFNEGYMHSFPPTFFGQRFRPGTNQNGTNRYDLDADKYYDGVTRPYRFKEENDTDPFDERENNNPMTYATGSATLLRRAYANYNNENDTYVQSHHVMSKRSTTDGSPTHSAIRMTQGQTYSSGWPPSSGDSRYNESGSSIGYNFRSSSATPEPPSWSFAETSNRGRRPPSFDEVESSPLTCTGDQFKCLDGYRCILKSQRCDGKLDCVDHSDEKDCEDKDSCRYGLFRCTEGKCIISSFLCNATNWSGRRVAIQAQDFQPYV